MNPKTIAIDGPAASGKSTLAKRLADHFNYLYFDTGVMYRAVTWAAIQSGVDINDEAAISELANRVQIDVKRPSKDDGRAYDVLLNGQDVTWEIRRSEVEAHVSVVSASPGVRKAMTEQQRRIGVMGNVVMVGRDIGTVVMPDADLKIYLDASVEERARRRYEEISLRDGKASFEEILESMRRRDQIDSTRAVAPLRPAFDAKIVNSDGLTLDEVYQKVLDLLKQT